VGTTNVDKPRHYCGVFGIANHPEAAVITRMGLYALQHRGQESCGIFLKRKGMDSDIHKGMGLVSEVLGKLPKEWRNADHEHAIGHVRYSTAGSSSLVNAQPFCVEFDKWSLGVAHNGNLSNGGVLRDRLKQSGAILQGSTDTEVILHLAARQHNMGDPPWNALQSALKLAEGAYSIVAMCEDGVAAMRDPYGFRPLAMGRIGESVVFASESSAFDILGAEYERDVEPGEFVLVRPDGSVESHIFQSASRRAHCVFELIYFSRPDSKVFREDVYGVRRRLGAAMAKEAPVDADVVMPVPDGGVYAALGFAEASGIPFDMGIMRNHYVGRTFIQPNPEDRKAAVSVKLNPIHDAIVGKRVCLIDDSIVRGNTSRERVRLLREHGAAEVHMRISCPPHVNPCYYGIDFPDRDELIANHYSTDEIAKLINVDSLAYLSRDGMLAAVRESGPGDYCDACFTGNYPVKPKQRVERTRQAEAE
jgi:amidophosphoribosyltransferase